MTIPLNRNLLSPYATYNGLLGDRYNQQAVNLLARDPMGNTARQAQSFVPNMTLGPGDSGGSGGSGGGSAPEVPGWVGPVGTAMNALKTYKQVGGLLNSIRPNTVPGARNFVGSLMGNPNLGLLDAGSVGYNTLTGSGSLADLGAGPMKFGEVVNRAPGQLPQTGLNGGDMLSNTPTGGTFIGNMLGSSAPLGLADLGSLAYNTLGNTASWANLLNGPMQGFGGGAATGGATGGGAAAGGVAPGTAGLIGAGLSLLNGGKPMDAVATGVFTTIGTALGGPIGGAIGGLAANYFGGEPEPTKDSLMADANTASHMAYNEFMKANPEFAEEWKKQVTFMGNVDNSLGVNWRGTKPLPSFYPDANTDGSGVGFSAKYPPLMKAIYGQTDFPELFGETWISENNNSGNFPYYWNFDDMSLQPVENIAALLHPRLSQQLKPDDPYYSSRFLYGPENAQKLYDAYTTTPGWEDFVAFNNKYLPQINSMFA